MRRRRSPSLATSAVARSDPRRTGADLESELRPTGSGESGRCKRTEACAYVETGSDRGVRGVGVCCERVGPDYELRPTAGLVGTVVRGGRSDGRAVIEPAERAGDGRDPSRHDDNQRRHGPVVRADR